MLSHTCCTNIVGQNVLPLFSPGSSEIFSLDVLVSLLRQENAVDICVIKVPQQIKYAEYFIVVSGVSVRHLRAMASYAIKVVTILYFLFLNHWYVGSVTVWKTDPKDCFPPVQVFEEKESSECQNRRKGCRWLDVCWLWYVKFRS